ncbi:MAG TPA: hypothetical protein VHN14_34380, partial [Kofleriaceae bacterium]|nr:hypothetical protein [Kofleriaceae bacterium]
DVSREIEFEPGLQGSGLAADVYVADLHKDGMFLPRKQLHHAIRNSASAERYFFTGMRGAGKSTELRRLKRDLEDDGMVVFYADMTEYLPLNSPVEIGDFLLVVMSALANCVHEDPRFAKDLAAQGALARFVAFLKTEIQLEGIDWTVDAMVQKVGFKFKVKQNPQFKAQLQAKSRGVLDGLVRESQAFVNGLVAYVRSRTTADTGVVLMVDSVERLNGIGEEAKKVFDSVENLFASHRDKLRFASLSVIYSVPPYISAVAQAGGSSLVISLPLPHVFEKPAPGGHGLEHQEGVDRVIDVVARRFPAWRTLLSELHLRRLVRNTGGDLRELFLLLREALNLVDPDDDDQFPIPEAVVAQAEKLRRNQFGIIPVSDLQWLVRVVATHGHGLPSLAELDTLARLLDGKLVFQYRNRENWYDVHPLLWSQVEAHAGAVAPG